MLVGGHLAGEPSLVVEDVLSPREMTSFSGLGVSRPIQSILGEELGTNSLSLKSVRRQAVYRVLTDWHSEGRDCLCTGTDNALGRAGVSDRLESVMATLPITGSFNWYLWGMAMGCRCCFPYLFLEAVGR